jgi:vitamin B12 transporter
MREFSDSIFAAMRILLGLCGIVAAATIRAQTGSDEIVVVGSRLAEDGFGSRNAFVRGRDEIDREMPGDTEQLLQRIPGVSLYRPGGPGGVSEIFLRGGESNFTAVYIDGVRLNDSTNTRGGSFDFSTLPEFRIGRMALAPGAMSAIYGSDTMAGVILIETAWPAPGELRARAEVGSQSDWRAGLGSAFAFGDRLELALIGSVGDAGDGMEGSMLETADLGARLQIGRGNAAAWTLIARFAQRDRTSFPEVSGGAVHAVLRELESNETQQASLSAHTRFEFSADWNAELTVSRAGTTDDFRSPPIAPGAFDGQPAFTTRTDFDRTAVLFVNRYRIGPALHSAFGVDLVVEKGRDAGSIELGGALLPATYALDRDVRSVFVEIGKRLDAGFDATIALRADRANGRGEVSGKLDLSKELPAIGGRLWTTLANGFKLPGFFALGNPLYGNPRLAPERVRSLEIGFEREPVGRIGYGVSLFRNAYEDLIDFDFETFSLINRASVDIEGVQSWLSVSLTDSLTVTADATILSIGTGDGSTLPRRPEQTGGIAVAQTFGQGWSLTGSVRHVGRRTITSIPTGAVEDGSYRVADLVLRRHTDRRTDRRTRLESSWWIALDNALDAGYMDAPGFAAPGTRIRLGTQVVY